MRGLFTYKIMAGRITFSIILHVLVLIQSVQNSKLNVPRILLPLFNDLSTKFTLETTEGGCYQWSTTRIDVINLTPLDVDPKLECSGKVVVTTVTKERTRNIAVVLAEDVHTRQVLRCDVIVDVIESLAVITTTRELFMEEAPEAFEVRAYDLQGNEFTTLEDVEFDWSIVCLGPNKDLTVLRFMTFKDSPYETPETIGTIEELNKKGHIALLEGVKTGSAKVTVKLPYEEYKDLKPHEVQLSVIANLILMPADVYIMSGDTISFQIIHMNNGRMEEIELPNPQYYLDVESKVVAVADTESGQITGLKDGRTKVILHDRNVEQNDSGLKLPSATLNVVTPAYMTLNILPYRNWAILMSEHHDIVAEVYSSNDHKIHLGSEVQIRTQVGELFHVQQRSRNGSWLTGWAKDEGVAPVTGILESVNNPKQGNFQIDPQVTARAELFVFPHIFLSPTEIILPWDPVIKPKYEIEIKAMGGDGKFLWSSSNHSVGVVTQSGLVRTHSHGYFEVSAAMMRNHHNRQSALFHIQPPTRLEIVEFVMEAEVGSVIFLHVALYADLPVKEGVPTSQIPFTKCQELPFRVKPTDSNFVYNKSAIIAPVGISCANVAIVGLNVGVSKVSVTYFSEGKPLEDSVTVSTFKALQMLHPRHCEIVLAVGTSTHLVFTGGPRPVVGRPSLHKRIVVSQDNSTVQADDITDSLAESGNQDLIVLNVLCLKLGQTEVSLSVTNSPLLPNCRNQESSSRVTVICGKPRSVFLQPEMKVADVHSCPMDLSADRVVVQSYKNIELDVAVTDENGRRFLNASSLKFEWAISPLALGELGSLDSVFSRNVTQGSVIFANRSYQIVSPKSETGIIEITATVVGYHRDRLNAYGIVPEWPEFVSEDEKGNELPPITAGIHLYLVDDTVVTPNITSIYNHPGNKKIVSVKQGSGYYELGLSDEHVADVKYLEGSREIEIIPVHDGDLRITLIDLCLVSQPAVVIVHVVSVSIIRVEMSDKVEIGRCISCIVRLYDESDNLLSVPDLGMIDLKVNLEDDIATLKRLKEDKEKPWAPGEIHYVVTGAELGDTKLTFSIGETSSAAIDLQVFPPLRIYPRNATLLMGAVLQFSSKGGPQPDNNVEYSAVTKNTADVTAGGLAQGLTLGHTKVHARATGINPTTGLRIIYSQDYVDLQVISVVGVKIAVPLARFQVGATVPIWANGLPEQLSPMILGTVQPPLRFEWDVDDNEIITIHGIFKEYGIEYLPEDDVSIRVTGRSPGRTTLHLNVVVHGAAADRADRLHVVYSTSVDLEVFENLQLTSPTGVSGGFVLMAPHSQVQLQTNMDSIGKLQYSLSTSVDSSSDGKVSAQKSLSIPNPIVTVSETGLLQSHSVFGRAMVLVSSVDEHGLKQTLSFIVEVKPVHYMLLNVVANWHVDTLSPINVVPLGTDFELRATYHDNTGAKFIAGTTALKLRTTRFDLIRIRPGQDNSSVRVSTKKPGFTLIKVWSEGLQKTVDYVKLHVGPVVSPVTDHLTVGDIICIWTPLVTTANQTGRWSSSERSLVAIDGNTGIGRVAGVRGGHVTIGHSLHPSASLHLQVVPASQIKMLPSAGQILTNAPDASIYQVPLVLASEKSAHKTKNLLTGWNCREELDTAVIYHPFTCKLEFTNNTVSVDVQRVFLVQTGFNPETGQYSCDILPGVDSGPNVSTLYANVSVWAELNDASGIQAEAVVVHFIPAIYVDLELILDDTSYTSVLSIVGLDYVLDEVSVNPVDKNLLHVYEGQRPQQNLLTHEISLLDYHWKLDELGEPMNLVVTSKLTGQIIKVHVRTQSAGDTFNRPQCSAISKHSPLVSLIYNYRHTLAIIISMLVIFFITFYAYSRYIQPAITLNTHQNRSLLNSSTQGLMPARSQYSPSQTMGCPCPSGYTPSPRSSSTPQNRNTMGCFNDNRNNSDTVYGDPSNFYSTSPESRRQRRYK